MGRKTSYECTRVPHSDISIMCFADDERELKAVCGAPNIDAEPKSWLTILEKNLHRLYVGRPNV